MAFETAFVTVDLPENWKCDLDRGVWICGPPANATPAARASALFLFQAAVKGAEDFIKVFDFQDTVVNRYFAGRPGARKPNFAELQTSKARNLADKIQTTNLNGFLWEEMRQDSMVLAGYRLIRLVSNDPKQKLGYPTFVVLFAESAELDRLAPQWERLRASLRLKKP